LKHGSTDDKKEKPYLPQSQSVPQVSLSPHTLLRTKSEQTMPTSGDAAIQRQEVSMNLKKLINEEKKKLQMHNTNKTEDNNKTDTKEDNNIHKNGATEPINEISPREARRELTLHGAHKKETSLKREPIKREASIREPPKKEPTLRDPITTKKEPPVISVSEYEPYPDVSPILPRSMSVPKINKLITEEEEISNMFDSLFDWYDTKPTPRKESEEENNNTAKRESSFSDMDDDTFDNILATLKTLEQLDAK